MAKHVPPSHPHAHARAAAPPLPPGIDHGDGEARPDTDLDRAPVADRTLPFGPYSGLDVDFVAVADPGYLLGLVREGVGPAGLRAEAAQALATHGRWVARDATWRVPLGDRTGSAPHGPAAAWGDADGDGRFRGAGGAGRAARALGRWTAGAAGAASLRRGHVTLALAAVLGAALLTARDGGPADTAPAIPTAPSVAAAVGPSGAGWLAFDARAAATRPATSPGLASGAAQAGEASSAATTPSAAAGPPAPCGARVPGAIPAESAADHLDTFQAVEFEVVQAKDTGRVTFLNSRAEPRCQPAGGYWGVRGKGA